MKKSFALAIILLLLPFLYLYMEWHKIPDPVPIHFNLQGEADRWAAKSKFPFILLIPLISACLVMLLISVVPNAEDDAGKKASMRKMSGRLVPLLGLFFSVLLMAIIHESACPRCLPFDKIISVGILLLMATLGWMMRVIQPNFYFGIRTPWTLTHEDVWKKTHLWGSKFIFFGCLSGIIPVLLLPLPYNIFFVIAWILLLCGITIFYSYKISRRYN